jgi:glutaredoxin
MVVQYEIYGRDGCEFCDKARLLLEDYARPYKYIKIGRDITKAQFLSLFPEATTVPQITLDGLYIGGYTDLEKHCLETW